MRPDPFAWTPHPEALAAIALTVAAYALATRRHRAARRQVALFAAAVALLLATAVTPLDSLTYHLLTAHLLQNVVLAEWAPALLVAAVPLSLADELDRLPAWRRLTRPVVALPLWIAVYSLWHLPPAYDTALRHPNTLLHLEHASYLAAGVLVWWPVFQGRLSYGVRAGYLFLAFALASPIGLLLAVLPEPAYDFYADGFEPWGLTALADQTIAGITMATEQALGFFALFVWAFFRFLRDEERPAAEIV
ncbi:MAG: cytochrome c oxidase assembly protein [Thermoleophilia bacterium]|nr:cytochrome c oxidase assembly protein [Thermoleophilia bacterium]